VARKAARAQKKDARQAERAKKRVARQGERVARKAVKASAKAQKVEVRAKKQAANRAAKEARRAGKGPATGHFWREVLVADDLRLREHIRTGSVDVRTATNARLHKGKSLEEGRAVFTHALGTPRQAGDHLVLLLHGYGGKARRMVPLRDALRAEGFVAEVVQYPSLFRSVDEIAKSIADLCVGSAALHGGRIKTVSLVAFSMGGLVASSVVTMLQQRNAGFALGRLVTIGTPHRGSPLADLTNWLSFLGGPNITRLCTRNDEELASLRRSGVPFGVIAGDGVRNGWTLVGQLRDGDGVVPLSSAVIEGAEDQLVVQKVKHTRLPGNTTVLESVGRYLRSGRFGTKGAAR
jgi:pimeloyl-ACP methyl ester carboxylesterase